MHDTATVPVSLMAVSRAASRRPLIDDELAEQLLGRAQAEGAELLGPDGLLSQLTKAVLERALVEELTGHLGYDKHDPAGRGSGNSRNGATPKTVLTDVGAVDLAVPRDRDGSFEPQIVRKGQTRLAGFNERIITLYARGMTTRDIRAHLRQMYDVDVSPDLISRVTDGVLEELAEWQSRPLDAVYPVIFIDALMVKIRDGVVSNRPVYLAIGIDCEGARQVLGLWVGPSTGESARFWMSVLAELKGRGVADVCAVGFLQRTRRGVSSGSSARARRRGLAPSRPARSGRGRPVFPLLHRGPPVGGLKIAVPSRRPGSCRRRGAAREPGSRGSARRCHRLAVPPAHARQRLPREEVPCAVTARRAPSNAAPRADTRTAAW